MKTCAYCGFENDEAATVCGQCGGREFKTTALTDAVRPERGSATPTLRLGALFDQPERVFRGLVVAAAAGPLLGVALPRIESRFMAYDTITLLNHNGHGALLTPPESVWWVTTLLSLVIAFGLYRFSAAARLLFTAFTVGFGVLGLFFGVCISSPCVAFLAWVTAVAQGGILVFAYCTPLRQRFS